jgi:protoporphyrinogen IX oxidase
MLWLKSFHIVFVVTWFAGLFYLPRLFVYHAMSGDAEVQRTLAVMERKLMIMTHIGGALTWVFGLLLLYRAPAWAGQAWMQAKLALVLLLSVYHVMCLSLLRQFAVGKNRHGHRWYRWFNEIPTVILVAVVLLVVLKPGAGA